MKLLQALCFVLLCLIVGCGNPTRTDKDSVKKIATQNQEIVYTNPNNFKPFHVYSDKGLRKNHFTPSGFMPNDKCISFNNSYTEDCYSGTTCIRIVYGVQCSNEDQNWAGIYWLNPPDNWGQRKGGYNITGAQRLSFWAKGEKGSEQIQEFKIGGITGDYPDSDIAVIGPVILTPEWKQYVIDLRGKDLSYISGGFSWTTSAEVNPQACTFYLDDIKFE